MKYRLAWFCNRTCADDWSAWTSLYMSGFQDNISKLVAVETLEVWKKFRITHKRCIYCSQKLPKARQSTI